MGGSERVSACVEAEGKRWPACLTTATLYVSSVCNDIRLNLMAVILLFEAMIYLLVQSSCICHSCC